MRAGLAPSAAAPAAAGADGVQSAALAEPVLAPPDASPVPVPSTRPSLVSDPGFKLPEGQGCSGSNARFQALVDNDLKTGHVERGVHKEISTELATLRKECSDGIDNSEEVTLLRQRYGYPSS